MKKFTTILIVLAAQITNSVAQTLINGDFEEPGIGYSNGGGAGIDDVIFFDSAGSGQLTRAYRTIWVSLGAGSQFLPGWTVGGNGIYYNFAQADGRSCTSGNYGVELYRWFGPGDYRGGSISQEITDLKAGTNYFLFFDLRQPSLGPNTVVTVRVGPQSRSVLNSTFDQWQTQSFPFVATGQTMVVTFSAPAGTVPGVLLDKVHVSTNRNAPNVLQAKAAVGITVEGRQGLTYRIEYTDRLPAAQWSLLTRVTVTNSQTMVYDESVSAPKRFYRSVEE